MSTYDQARQKALDAVRHKLEHEGWTTERIDELMRLCNGEPDPDLYRLADIQADAERNKHPHS